MTDDKKPRECICHASWSGYNEQEWMARGCPECECWKVDAYDALAKENEELKKWNEQQRTYFDENAALRESLKFSIEALSKIENECACPTPEKCYDYAVETLAKITAKHGDLK
jgi:hypothetical protein